ncbi:MAG: hypothetical protein E6K55_04005 [Gemmatimonadetes bacterium]|nr:MAG: hypothetical protein E6K55_04005 [Gemmatimonadota bacterium]
MRMRLAALLTATSGLAAALGCGLSDAFASARLEGVVLTWSSDSVLTQGATVPVVITVSTNGTPVPSPRLALSSSDTTIVAVNAAGDSLSARALGKAVVTARLESSVLTDSLPTLTQSLRVRP